MSSKKDLLSDKLSENEDDKLSVDLDTTAELSNYT
jgi:hypothetical protein